MLQINAATGFVYRYEGVFSLVPRLYLETSKMSGVQFIANTNRGFNQFQETML
jgi:hypothetical protein